MFPSSVAFHAALRAKLLFPDPLLGFPSTLGDDDSDDDDFHIVWRWFFVQGELRDEHMKRQADEEADELLCTKSRVVRPRRYYRR